MRRLITLIGCICIASMSVGISSEAVQNYQDQLIPYKVYITKTGSNINLLIPVNSLFYGATVYYVDESPALIGLMSELISRSQGEVFMSGVLTDLDAKDSVNTSALYEQVTSLSKKLLDQHSGVSYSPIKIKVYEKNEKYGIWKIYPDTETFISLSLNID